LLFPTLSESIKCPFSTRMDIPKPDRTMIPCRDGVISSYWILYTRGIATLYVSGYGRAAPFAMQNHGHKQHICALCRAVHHLVVWYRRETGTYTTHLPG